MFDMKLAAIAAVTFTASAAVASGAVLLYKKYKNKKAEQAQQAQQSAEEDAVKAARKEDVLYCHLAARAATLRSQVEAKRGEFDAWDAEDRVLNIPTSVNYYSGAMYCIDCAEKALATYIELGMQESLDHAANMLSTPQEFLDIEREPLDLSAV